MISEETEGGLYDRLALSGFARKVEAHRKELLSLLYGLQGEGKRIVGVSAPAKGNTLLNYCHLHTGILEYITEKAKIKHGLLAPGSHIPIVPDSQLLLDQPDYAMILAWNFADEIMKNLQAYRDRGGKFIIPIPKPIII